MHKEEFYNQYQPRTVNRTIKQRNEMGGTCVTLMLILEIVYVNFEILKKEATSIELGVNGKKMRSIK